MVHSPPAWVLPGTGGVVLMGTTWYNGYMGRGRQLVDERVPRPAMYSHEQWCRWLLSRGLLCQKHRRCTQTLYCVAHTSAYRGDD